MVMRWTDIMKCEKIAATCNDGFELMLGYPSNWEFSIRREDAMKLAWFIIRWRIAEWFGLRRAIWYWLLHRRCERSNKMGRMFLEREKAN
jgi:hypothetical protein